VVDRLRFELQNSANSRQTHGDEFPDTTGFPPRCTRPGLRRTKRSGVAGTIGRPDGDVDDRPVERQGQPAGAGLALRAHAGEGPDALGVGRGADGPFISGNPVLGLVDAPIGRDGILRQLDVDVGASAVIHVVDHKRTRVDDGAVAVGGGRIFLSHIGTVRTASCAASALAVSVPAATWSWGESVAASPPASLLS